YTNEANRYQAWDMESDGNHDYGKGYEGEITSNLIQGYNPTTQYLIMNGGLVDPGVFKDSGVTGNYHLTGYSLGFTQTGDNNVLSYVKDTHGTIVTNVKEETPPNQKTDYYKGKGPIPDTSIDFFPLDNLINPNHQDYNAKYLDYANNKSTYSNGPGEGGVHNDYFGMKYKIVFKIGEYVGPLSWYFTGDDDLWVILDAEADNCGTVVADAGGVHQPVRVDTDLWPYVLGINGNAAEMQKYNADPTAYIENADYDRNAEHSLTILWMERGATDSNCFMEYTLPGAHMVPVDAIPVDIDVRKVDSKTGKPLAGAEFNISRVLDGVTYDLGNYESGEDGVVNLGKYYDGVYLLKETKVPRGYLVEDVLYRITVANGDYTLERQERGGAWEPIEAPIGKEPLIPNVAYFELPMEGTKTDQNGNPLEGAKFKIYTDEELTKALDIKKVVSGTGESEVVTWYDETVSGSDGKFDITIKGDDFKEDLNYSNPDDLTQQKYELVAYLKETEAPEGYITDSQSHKIKFEIITRITKIDGSVVQEVVSFNVVHLCDDKESCLVSVDSRVIPGSDPEKIVFYLDYKNFAPPHNVPRISLSKTFKGLTLEQVVALKDTYQIALSAKANAPLSYADAIQIMDADGNLLDLDNLTSEQLKETGEYTFVWRMEGISTGIYKVTESGETVNGYGTIRRGFNEDQEVDDTLWNFAEGKPAVTELDRSTYSTWQNGENKLLIAKLTMDYGYLVYTNEKLTMSQELEFVDYINSLSGKPVATYMNTYFYSDDDIRGDGIKYGSGNKLSLNDQGQLQVQNANAWEKFYGGDYAWDGKRVADIETSNEYVLTEMDLRKITLDNNEVEGAKFRLSKRKEGTVPSGQEKYEVVEGYENFAIINGTTGDYKELKDMKEGIYLLEETLAPVGCTLLDEKIYFQISWDSQNEKFTVRLCDEDGNDLTTTPYMWKLDENTFTLTIANHLHYALPQSGGHGIYLYTIFGTILMMLGAFVIYFGRRNGVGMY
ncbi:MAG: LPXTG cell wall anchor domain-containing protein, partial [Blautia sp.]|nr:LPXTG cell wall anchor domain-containing protein [Blautia sp.]